MAYQPTTREITIEFRPLRRPKSRRQVIVTPEYAEVRYGDTIVWKVQGAPAATEVSVGNITFHGDPVGITSHRGSFVLRRPTVMRDSHLRQTGKDHHWTIETTGCELGDYKYDVIVDGTTVLDPEVEIKGPKGY